MIVGITDLADQGMILPAFVLTGIGLAVMGWWRGALAWVLTIPGVLCLVLGAKVFVYSCGAQFFQSWGVYSPSGHTAAAAAVYGGLLGLLVRRCHRGETAILCATGFSVLIGSTRVMLRLHTVNDAIAGAILGIAGAYVLVRLAGPRPQRLRLKWTTSAVIGGCMVFVAGTHLPVEHLIRGYARTHMLWLC
jgi:membrane-associated phospholipid phosphatase